MLTHSILVIVHILTRPYSIKFHSDEPLKGSLDDKKNPTTLHKVLYKKQQATQSTHTNKINIQTKCLQLWAFRQVQWARIEFTLLLPTNSPSLQTRT